RLTSFGVGVHRQSGVPGPGFLCVLGRLTGRRALLSLVKDGPELGHPWADIGTMPSPHVALCCGAPKCAQGRVTEISCPGNAAARNSQSVQLLRIAGAARRIISLNKTKVPWRFAWGEGKLVQLDPFGGPRDGAQPRHARRQVRPDEEPDLRHRLPGAGAALPDAEGA